MRWWPVVLGIVALAVILLFAVSVSAQPEESPDAPADSSEAESPQGADPGDDSVQDDEAEGAQPDSPEGETTGGRRRGGSRDDGLPEGAGHWFWDTHPDLAVKISRKKDVTNWDTKIALRKRISSKLNVNLSASLVTRENTTLNRSDSGDGVTAGLKYRLSDNIGFGLKYNSNVSAYRYNLNNKEPDDRKGKEDVSVSAEFSHAVAPGVDIRLTTNAGKTQNAYGNVKNRGGRQEISAALNYVPHSRLKTSVSYNAKRLLLDATVEEEGEDVFASKDRTFNQDLSVTAAYDVMPGVRLNADAGRTDRQKQYPDQVLKEQETELRSSRNARVGAAFDVLRRLTFDVTVRFSDSDNRFLLHSEKDNSSRRTAATASAKLLPWQGATLNLGGSREESRNAYTTTDTGRNLHQSLTLKLTQDLGPKADLNLTALSDMAQVFYFDKVANDNDRDRVNNRVALNVNYKPRDLINTRLGAEYTDEQTVYTQTSRSQNNRTTRKYRVNGSYDLKTFRKVGLKQNYDISAIYTFYEYGEGRNTLVRNSNISTKFAIPLGRSLNINVNHSYKFQDQGNYREEGGQRLYSRSNERETNILGINLRYTLLRFIRFTLRQSYQIQRSWTYIEGVKTLQREAPTLDLGARIGFNYKFGERTEIKLSIEENRKEGSTVSDAFRKYRNIEFEASHVF